MVGRIKMFFSYLIPIVVLTIIMLFSFCIYAQSSEFDNLIIENKLINIEESEEILEAENLPPEDYLLEIYNYIDGEINLLVTENVFYCITDMPYVPLGVINLVADIQYLLFSLDEGYGLFFSGFGINLIADLDMGNFFIWSEAGFITYHHMEAVEIFENEIFLPISVLCIFGIDFELYPLEGRVAIFLPE